MSNNNKIITIGIQIADLPVIRFNSLASLSPYNTIVFRPKCDNGKYSAEMDQYITHWHEELTQAYSKGKNIILLLPNNAFYDTADAKRVNLLNSISFIHVSKRRTEGDDIVPNQMNMYPIFKEFCSVFEGLLQYSYVIKTVFPKSAILKNKDDEVLGQHLHDFGLGHIIILQDFFSDQMLVPPKRLTIGMQTTSKVSSDIPITKYDKVATNLKDFIVKLTKELPKTDLEYEQIPDWIEGVAVYDTREEAACKEKINDNKVEITRLNEQNKVLEEKKQKASILKSLLYANGPQLEKAINAALSILGASAEEYESKKDTLQIDNLIHYNGVTLIGEDKGLDGYSGNGDIGQLTNNANQYYELACTSEDEFPQKILFINSERKKELTERKREQCCSDKVFKLLKANLVLVVWTPDLFFITKYVKDTNDREFAHKCMDCLIKNTYGLVEFPKTPIDKID